MSPHAGLVRKPRTGLPLGSPRAVPTPRKDIRSEPPHGESTASRDLSRTVCHSAADWHSHTPLKCVPMPRVRTQRRRVRRVDARVHLRRARVDGPPGRAPHEGCADQGDGEPLAALIAARRPPCPAAKRLRPVRAAPLEMHLPSAWAA
eukprot:3559085-Prymnesium_polylepis.3